MDKISSRIRDLCSKARTLRIIIPEELSHAGSFDKDTGAFIFTRIYPNAPTLSADKEVRVLVQSIIHESDHSTVYLGLFKSVQVVLKCCYDVDFYKDFKQEARVYGKRLKNIQGDIVPAFFGYYQALDEECGPYSLLLLEYCGERIPRSFCNLDKGKRVHILNVLGRFHIESRLHITDFSERNVLFHDGEYRLIRFHNFKTHSCDWTEDVDWEVGRLDSSMRKNFPCGLLADVASDMRIWSLFPRPMVEIQGRFFPASEFPTQEVIDKLSPDLFFHCKDNWEWIKSYFQQVKKEIDEGDEFNLDEQMANRPLPPIYPRL